MPASRSKSGVNPITSMEVSPFERSIGPVWIIVFIAVPLASVPVSWLNRFPKASEAMGVVNSSESTQAGPREIAG